MDVQLSQAAIEDTDKDGLLFAVVDEGFERSGRQLIAAATSGDDPIARLNWNCNGI